MQGKFDPISPHPICGLHCKLTRPLLTDSMQTDLNMNSHNNAYTIVSLVFFFTYAIGQPPATVLIRKIGPRIFLAGIVFAWGVVMIVSTTCHSDSSTRNRSLTDMP